MSHYHSTGQVGKACAYSILIRCTFDEMVLVDEGRGGSDGPHAWSVFCRTFDTLVLVLTGQTAVVYHAILTD